MYITQEISIGAHLYLQILRTVCVYAYVLAGCHSAIAHLRMD